MIAYIYLKTRNKLIKDIAVSYPEGAEAEVALQICLEQIPLDWDLPRPMILHRHIRDFQAFGRAVFQQDHFVEPFRYSLLEIEAADRPDGIDEGYDED